eukprot:TRINITY_DN40118_c0_g1_i1.p1 TRINITY_DN40118_c0_g1~~TRINITY_DN40118_c0_g1_i1.p1  ORF type:complete len:205 (-),score=14.87 TRINITY_DN40118_c0_g1_i1:90-626(-)
MGSHALANHPEPQIYSSSSVLSLPCSYSTHRNSTVRCNQRRGKLKVLACSVDDNKKKGEANGKRKRPGPLDKESTRQGTQKSSKVVEKGSGVFWDSFLSGNGGEDPNANFGVSSFAWRDLLDPQDPDNMLAIALTGILSWATFQILWQLFFVSIAIVVAAVKYSLIAAILLLILITLL